MDVDPAQDGPSTSGRPPADGGPPPGPPPPSLTGVDERSRFVVELEFVQGLANPAYLNWLAQNRFLDDPAFVHYLKYLEYWRQPQYAKYIRYPHCLLMLELLQSEHFQKAVALTPVMEDIHGQQFYHWQHYRTNRVRDGTAAVEGPAAAAVAVGGGQQPAAAAAGGGG